MHAGRGQGRAGGERRRHGELERDISRGLVSLTEQEMAWKQWGRRENREG